MGSWLRWRRRLGLSLLISVLAHAAVYLLLHRAAFSPPALEFKLPTEVEFGLIDGTGEPAPAPAPPPPPPPQPIARAAVPEPKPAPEVEASDSEGPVIDAGLPEPELDASPRDAGVADAPVDGGLLADAAIATGPDAGVHDPYASADGPFGEGDTPGARGDGFGVGAGGHGLGGFAPPGAAIGLHVDLVRVRSSSLRLEEQALLGIIPGWRGVLKGSGFDPLARGVMRRVFVATPDLDPEHLVVAVRYDGKQARVERAVGRLARRRSATAEWRQRDGYRVAPWLGTDPTERVVALVADDQFTITRPGDLSRVLAVARALGQRQRREGMRERSGGTRALLDMLDDEAVALTLEDARRFVVGEPKGIPGSLRVSVFSVDEFHARLLARGRYDSPEQARAAVPFLEDVRTALLAHPRVEFLGMTTAVERAEVRAERDVVWVDVELTLHQLRYLVQHLSAALRGSERAP